MSEKNLKEKAEEAWKCYESLKDVFYTEHPFWPIGTLILDLEKSKRRADIDLDRNCCIDWKLRTPHSVLYVNIRCHEWQTYRAFEKRVDVRRAAYYENGVKKKPELDKLIERFNAGLEKRTTFFARVYYEITTPEKYDVVKVILVLADDLIPWMIKWVNNPKDKDNIFRCSSKGQDDGNYIYTTWEEIIEKGIVHWIWERPPRYANQEVSDGRDERYECRTDIRFG